MSEVDWSSDWTQIHKNNNKEMANKHQAIKQLPAWTAWAYITYHRPIYVFLFMKSTYSHVLG